MRVNVNHLTLGMFYEAYLVCTKEYEGYFRCVANMLADNHAVHTGVFVYDSQELTPGVKFKLKNCRNVIFLLTNNDPAIAAEDENHPFRKIYSYVNRKNPHSVSLVGVNGCTVDYTIKFPQDMKSFDWLHRKSCSTIGSTPAELAYEFFTELRHNHNEITKNKLSKLYTQGSAALTKMYKTSAIASAVAILGYLGFRYIPTETTFGRIIAVISLIISIISAGILPLMWLINLDETYDCSTVFKDFRALTRKRMKLLGSLVLIPLMLQIYLNVSETKAHAAANVFGIPLGLIFVYSALMLILLKLSKDHLRFATKRYKARLFALPVILSIMAVYIFFLIQNILIPSGFPM